jgi:hypothetical protein
MTAILVNLDADELERLRRLSAERGEPIEAIVQGAVSGYLSRLATDEAAWRQRLGVFLAEVHRNLPADVPQEQIESDITAARDEVGQARRAARGH